MLPAVSFLLGVVSLTLAAVTPANVTIPASSSLIHYHGRWDSNQGAWWESTGFKLRVRNLSSLTLDVGPHTNALVPLGVSVDYGPFQQVNVTEGLNTIPLVGKKNSSTTIVRVRTEIYYNERFQLSSLILNKGASLLPYNPSKLRFQVIGDSFSTGYEVPKGADQAWPALIAENFKAELTVNAQSGAALTDAAIYGNPRGMSYLFFRTEDSDYYYSTDHNYTTPWDFKRDLTPTHVVIHIGANDVGLNITTATFTATYNNFFVDVRKVYPTQPIFVFTPWGWPQSPDSPNSYYFDGAYEAVVNQRKALGDKNVFLVNTTTWVTWPDVDSYNRHPNVSGHAKIAKLFTEWLKDWGLKVPSAWPTNG